MTRTTLCNISDVPEIWVLVPKLLFSETVRDVAQTLTERHGGEFVIEVDECGNLHVWVTPGIAGSYSCPGWQCLITTFLHLRDLQTNYLSERFVKDGEPSCKSTLWASTVSPIAVGGSQMPRALGYPQGLRFLMRNTRNQYICITAKSARARINWSYGREFGGEDSGLRTDSVLHTEYSTPFNNHSS